MYSLLLYKLVTVVTSGRELNLVIGLNASALDIQPPPKEKHHDEPFWDLHDKSDTFTHPSCTVNLVAV